MMIMMIYDESGIIHGPDHALGDFIHWFFLHPFSFFHFFIFSSYFGPSYM